jgi:hypothetical protein
MQMVGILGRTVGQVPQSAGVVVQLDNVAKTSVLQRRGKWQFCGMPFLRRQKMIARSRTNSQFVKIGSKS